MTAAYHRLGRIELNADFDALITDIARARVDEHGAVIEVNPDAPSFEAESDDEWRGEFAKYLANQN